MLDGKSAADIDRIQLGTDLLQLAIQVDHLIQLTPVIDIVLDAFVQKDMKHLQLEFVFVALDLVYIKFQDVFRADAKPGSIKRKRRLFFRGNPDAQLERHSHGFRVFFQFSLLSSTGITFLKPVLSKLCDAAWYRVFA